MSVAMRSLWVMTTGVIPSTTVFSGRRGKKKKETGAERIISSKFAEVNSLIPLCNTILLRQYVAGDGGSACMFPVRRVNQRVNLHFLFVVRNRWVSLSTAFTRPRMKIHPAMLKLQSVTGKVSHFTGSLVPLWILPSYMYTCAGKASSFFSFFLSKSRQIHMTVTHFSTSIFKPQMSSTLIRNPSVSRLRSCRGAKCLQLQLHELGFVGI